MYTFNNDNIFTNYIKQLLHSFNLPNCGVYKPGMKIFKDCIYLYNNYIYSALSTTSNSTINNLKNLGSYHYNSKILNITKNLEIKNFNYDSYTHQYLGDYLRFRRDYDNFNLMSMYNCCNNEINNNLYIDLPDNNILFDSDDLNYKIYMVPVKFFQTYSIGIDSDLPIEIIAGLYKNNDQIEFDNTSSNGLYSNSYEKFNYSKYSKPNIYDKLKNIDINVEFYNQEDNLKLFIKIPANCKSSIVVLEGDYSTSFSTYIDEELNEKLTYINNTMTSFNANSTKNYISKLQLLQLNTGINYPFADRLIEYLLINPISPDTDVPENIKVLQKKLSSNAFKSSTGLNYTISKYGLWDKGLRNTLYNYIRKYHLTDNSNFDLLGYVDKNVEIKLGDLS